MAEKPLYDSSLFWTALGGGTALIGGIVLSVGVAQIVADTSHPNLWTSVWFDVGFIALVTGAGALSWALVLFLAHRHAEKHFVPSARQHGGPGLEQAQAKALADTLAKPVSPPRPGTAKLRAELADNLDAVKEFYAEVETIAGPNPAIQPAPKAPPPAAHPLGDRLRAVSGETVVREVLSPRDVQTTQYHVFGKYVPADAVADLKLAEVALLRRMTTRLEHKRASRAYYDDLSENLSRRECENILAVGGVADPNLSLIRLEQRRLIRSEDGEVAVIVESPPGYSGGGGRLAHDFTECLLRDPLVLAAYRKISLAIDKVIQPQPMERLVSDEVSYEDWLASSSL